MQVASLRPTVMNFVNNAFSVAKKYGSVKELFVGKKESPPFHTVRLRIVNEVNSADGCEYIDQSKKVTVIYDSESLDSLYGLSFFKFRYGDRIHAVPYQNVTSQQKEIPLSQHTFILGVDLPMADLLYINSRSDSVRILSYRGSFDYLYDVSLHGRFTNVTLYMADFAFEIGGPGIEQFENTIASMIKIMYYDTGFKKWPQAKFSQMVSHVTAMYPLVPDYGLTKATLVLRDGKGEAVNPVGSLMMDFRHQLEAAAMDTRGFEKIHELQPVNNSTDYLVRRRRLADHIARTQVLQSWKSKGGGLVTVNTVPAFSHDINDLVELATINKNTIVCVEDAGLITNYYIYSHVPGRAERIAKAIKGDTQWRRGLLFCVSKAKDRYAHR